MIMIKFGVVVVIFVGYCAELLLNLLFFVFFFQHEREEVLWCGDAMWSACKRKKENENVSQY